jgi:hypothetical protein
MRSASTTSKCEVAAQSITITASTISKCADLKGMKSYDPARAGGNFASVVKLLQQNNFHSHDHDSRSLLNGLR